MTGARSAFSELDSGIRGDHFDLSIHRCGSRTYEWGYSQNSQREKGSELDKKEKKLGLGQIFIDNFRNETRI